MQTLAPDAQNEPRKNADFCARGYTNPCKNADKMTPKTPKLANCFAKHDAFAKCKNTMFCTHLTNNVFRREVDHFEPPRCVLHHYSR